MSAFSDFLDKNNDLINKVNEAIMYGDFHAVKEVYIDLPLLKDTRLGLILATDKDALPYVVANLKSYLLRPNRSFTFAYPKLKFKEKEYQQMYRDPKYATDLFNRSPDTSLSGSLPTILRILRTNNDRVKYTGSLHVTVNTFPIKENELTDQYRKMLTKAADNLAIIDFVCIDPLVISSKQWQSTDIAFLDSISYELSAESTIYKPLFQDVSMGLTKIYAPYDCDDSILQQWKRYNVDFTDKETVKTVFAPTEVALNAFCHFLFASFDVNSNNK
jgi:hypothetical protein